MGERGDERSRFRLPRERTGLILVDAQERLLAAMPKEARERTLGCIRTLLSLAGRMGLPAIATEQYPKGLGSTLPELKEVFPDFSPVEKMTFSGCGAPEFWERLRAKDLSHLLVAGLETHVCVFQTVCDLLEAGYTVHVPADAVCSRTKANWETGLRLMGEAGAVITSTETAVFDLLRVAGTDDFKFMSRLLK